MRLTIFMRQILLNAVDSSPARQTSAGADPLTVCIPPANYNAPPHVRYDALVAGGSAAERNGP